MRNLALATSKPTTCLKSKSVKLNNNVKLEVISSIMWLLRDSHCRQLNAEEGFDQDRDITRSKHLVLKALVGLLS